MKKQSSPLWLRLTAVALLLTLSTVFSVCTAALIYLADSGVFWGDANQEIDNAFLNSLPSKADDVRSWYEDQLWGYTQSEAFSRERTNLHITITDTQSGTTLYDNQLSEVSYWQQSQNDPGESIPDSELYTAGASIRLDGGYRVEFSGSYDIFSPDGQTETVTIACRLPHVLEVKDSFYYIDLLLGSLISHRYALLATVFALLVLCLILWIYLICSAANTAVAAGRINHIPFDLYLAALAVLGIIALCIFFSLLHIDSSSLLFEVAALAWMAMSGTGLLLAAVLSFASRIQSGRWWCNTILYRLCRCVSYAVRSVPLYWKGGLLWSGLCVYELLFLAVGQANRAAIFAWLAEKAVLTPLLAVAMICMRRLQQAGKKLAQGDFEEEINPQYMFLDFKEHAQNLNSISAGLQTALDERMKSERMKTELITNVSHDIKTPLTSIINYVDLLKKQQISSPLAVEYLDVLDRQSARLKKLIVDLVEASKAAAGSLPVALEKTDINLVLIQAAGEYEDRLSEKKLKLVLNPAESSPVILADGKLLWRILDNLLGNICKYAFPGTRVYADVQTDKTGAQLIFRNISAYPLNISADELTERFVRGDVSRCTEGSGLGLSIAQSLTELQGGKFQIVIDGDLFKAIVRFPLCI